MYSQVVQADPSESCWFDGLTLETRADSDRIHQYTLITSYM